MVPRAEQFAPGGQSTQVGPALLLVSALNERFSQMQSCTLVAAVASVVDASGHERQLSGLPPPSASLYVPIEHATLLPPKHQWPKVHG